MSAAAQHWCPHRSWAPVRTRTVQPWCQRCPEGHPTCNICGDGEAGGWLDGIHAVTHQLTVATSAWYSVTVEQFDDPSSGAPEAAALDVEVGTDLDAVDAREVAAALLRGAELLDQLQHQHEVPAS